MCFVVLKSKTSKDIWKKNICNTPNKHSQCNQPPLLYVVRSRSLVKGGRENTSTRDKPAAAALGGKKIYLV